MQTRNFAAEEIIKGCELEGRECLHKISILIVILISILTTFFCLNGQQAAHALHLLARFRGFRILHLNF